MIDLQDFPEEYQAALKAADKACERAGRGLPPDRWATTEQMVAIFTRAIPALYAMPFQSAAEAYKAGYEAACKDQGTASMSLKE